MSDSNKKLFKKFLQFFYLRYVQLNALIALSKFLGRTPLIGKVLTVLCDNLILYIFGAELTSRSLDIETLVVGHSTGVVLGGNGIRCTGTLNVSSGVVFGRRYGPAKETEPDVFFDLIGDVAIGANSVLLGPLRIVGPTTIGALTLVTHDIEEPGVYVGIPAVRLR
jgi:serine acetyltransferase